MEAGRMIKDYMGHELGVHQVNRANLHLVRTGGSVLQNGGARALADLLVQLEPRQFVIQTEQRAAQAVLSHHRKNGDQDLFFLANTTNMAFDANVGIRKDGTARSTLEIWDIETGERSELETSSEGDNTTVSLRFEAYQSRLIVVGGMPEERAPEMETIELPVKGNWRLDLEDDNALRIDRFRMQVDLHQKGQNQGWGSQDSSEARLRAGRLFSGVSPIDSRALWLAVRPSRARNKVVLPAPLGPTMARNSSGPACSDTSLNSVAEPAFTDSS